MNQRKNLEKLATDPKSMLSDTKGIFSLIKAHDYELYECLCSDKLDRAHPEQDVRKFIDTELARRLDQKLSKDTPVHMLDIGSGMLFSSAVRVAELVRRGFKDVHIYLTDPIYDDNLQQKNFPDADSTDAKKASAAKKAFHEFYRLMQDCGISPILGDEQGNTKKIVTELKENKSGQNEPSLHIHIFGDIKQIPTDVMRRMNTVVIVDFFPPVSLSTILGDHKNYLDNEALIFSCKERFLSRAEMIDSLSKEDIEHFFPTLNVNIMTQIKSRWDNIVNSLYPADAKGNFDAFYNAVMSKALSSEMHAAFDDALRRISLHALEVRITPGSALQHIDWEDAVDIQGSQANHYLRNTDEPVPIYSATPFPLWKKNTSDTSLDEPPPLEELQDDIKQGFKKK